MSALRTSALCTEAPPPLEGLNAVPRREGGPWGRGEDTLPGGGRLTGRESGTRTGLKACGPLKPRRPCRHSLSWWRGPWWVCLTGPAHCHLPGTGGCSPPSGCVHLQLANLCLLDPRCPGLAPAGAGCGEGPRLGLLPRVDPPRPRREGAGPVVCLAPFRCENREDTRHCHAGFFCVQVGGKLYRFILEMQGAAYSSSPLSHTHTPAPLVPAQPRAFPSAGVTPRPPGSPGSGGHALLSDPGGGHTDVGGRCRPVRFLSTRASPSPLRQAQQRGVGCPSVTQSGDLSPGHTHVPASAVLPPVPVTRSGSARGARPPPRLREDSPSRQLVTIPRGRKAPCCVFSSFCRWEWGPSPQR